MADVDEFFDVKNAFYLGNYQQCINEAGKIKVQGPEDSLTRDLFMYRAFLANRKYMNVKDEIKSSSHVHLKSLLILADYLSGPASKEKIVQDLNDMFTNTVDHSNVALLIVAATIFIHEGDNDAALRALRLSEDLECIAMRVQILISIDRVDMAKKELAIMQNLDEDATLTQLAMAWLYIAVGGEKLQDAYYIFQEMVDKFGATPVLLNGQAAAHIAQGQLEEASSVLQEALAKNSHSNPDTMINMIVISELIGTPEVARRYLTQLKEAFPSHSFVKSFEQKENEFERLVLAYAA